MIERGPDQSFAAQDFRPLLEGQVRRQDDTRPFVGGADDVEQQFGSDLAGGHVPQLVDLCGAPHNWTNVERPIM